MIRWRFYEPSPMRDLLEQMMQMAGTAATHPGRGEPMPINVHQTDRDVVVEAALPGVRSEDIDVNWSEGVLSIRARSTVEDRDYLHQEIRTVEFMRQVALPVECRFEDATANFEHGILEIRIPKQRPRAPERIHISVNRGQGGGATTIEARRGKGYEEVSTEESGAKPAKPAPKRKRTGE
jgi:HSP20 family protein